MPFSSIMPFNTRFVEVPIRVIVPPATAAKDNGIRNNAGFQPLFSALALTLGMSNATTGVLFTKALKPAVKAVVKSKKPLGVLPTLLRNLPGLSCFLRTLVNEMSAITVSIDGLLALA